MNVWYSSSISSKLEDVSENVALPYTVYEAPAQCSHSVSLLQGPRGKEGMLGLPGIDGPPVSKQKCQRMQDPYAHKQHSSSRIAHFSFMYIDKDNRITKKENRATENKKIFQKFNRA